MRDYLWAYGLSAADFAKKIRYSTVHVCNCMNGAHIPSRRFEEDVERATNGKVRRHEIACKKGWLLEKQLNKKKKAEKTEDFEQVNLEQIVNE